MADYMITLKNMKTGRVRYEKNCIGENCIFSSYENALEVFKSRCKYDDSVSEVRLIRVQDGKEDVEVRVCIKYQQDADRKEATNGIVESDQGDL